MTRFCVICNCETERDSQGKCKPCRAIYNSKNRDKLNSASARYREKNREKLNEMARLYHAKNRDRNNQANAKYKKDNREKILAYHNAYYSKNREKLIANQISYFAANPDKRRIHEENRRARKVSNGGKISIDIVEKLFLLQKGKCACCGKPLGNNYHLDHIMPISLGGANVDSNIQLLRAKCNMEKHAKHPIDFMQKRGFLL